MLFTFKKEAVILQAENEQDEASLAALREAAHGHVFRLDARSLKGAALFDLGPQEDACREPINIVYTHNDQWQPISNLAETPFCLNGRTYASVEGFWQGLKTDDEDERLRIARLAGREAMQAGRILTQPALVQFEDRIFPAGGPDHRALMRQACEAKFEQHDLARATLLATGRRPLMHRVKHDSVTIPGALMADIWMRIRTSLKQQRSGLAGRPENV